MDIFAPDSPDATSDAPLAARLRPTDLADFVGQEHILSADQPLRREIDDDVLSSMILWGPPGCGKTTLARIIADNSEAHFQPFHAASEGVPRLRVCVSEAQERRKFHRKRTVLFMDEIHRFNKGQQDYLLPFVEDGTVILIGATTENPSFELNAPLLSRTRVIVMRPLDADHVRQILARALETPGGLRRYEPDVDEPVVERIVEIADGDARTALNLLESCVLSAPVVDGRSVVRPEHLAEVLKRHALRHDKRGDLHFQLISALIKSVRGSDPDAAVYWLARLLEAGEDARFIARRLVISASEDVGNADPAALPLATAAAHAVEYVGLPEAQLNLAQAATYLASAPKSNASYAALSAARAFVREHPPYPVPPHLRNAVTELQRSLGYAEGYQYGHESADGFLPQQHLPPEMADRTFYQPKNVGAEEEIARRVAEWRRRRSQAPESDPQPQEPLEK